MSANVQTTFLTKVLPEDVGGEKGTVQFILGNGTKASLSLKELTPEMVERLAIHGLSQKGGDAASGMSKARDFAGALNAIATTLDNLRNGLWSSRTGGGTSDLVLAIAKLKGVSEEEAAAAVFKATEEQLKDLRKHPAVKEAIAKLQAARAKEQAKGAESLDELVKGLGL